MKMKTLNHPLPDADMDFIKDTIFSGGIDYSFTDCDGITVDFDYLRTRLDDETLTEITDKVKDVILDILETIQDDDEDD